MRISALAMMLIGALVPLAGCDDGSSDGLDDCRQAQAACAPGFVCAPQGADGSWQCFRERLTFDMNPQPADLGFDDAAIADMAGLPDSGAPDMRSQATAEPGGACSDELPCADGACLDDHPGGFCEVSCGEGDECGETARCVDGVCLTDCSDVGCRAGWVCAADDAACRPHCGEVSCDDMSQCDEATGLCEPLPMCTDEICDGKDDDCDGLVDEGLLNACGDCGPLPDEVCDDEDNDCDGAVDEEVLNACGGCGEVPAEECDEEDNDCDGAVDEGLINACGACGPALPDGCDGIDDDCDGRVDEEAECGAGRACVDGECRRRSGPGGPCLEQADCIEGECVVDPTLPGGLCVLECAVDGDCGPNAICSPFNGICLESCVEDCRAGWVCYPADRACFPSCDFSGCNEGYVCGFDGLCEVPVATVTVSTIFILPGKSTGDTWDGFGTVPHHILAGAAAAAGAGIVADLAAFFAGEILGAYDAPDPYGTATLVANGRREVRLPEVQDTFTPDWVIEWNGVSLDPEADIRLSISLTDADLVNDDGIGRVEVGTATLQEALAAGQQIVVDTSRQGVGHIVAFSLSVALE